MCEACNASLLVSDAAAAQQRALLDCVQALDWLLRFEKLDDDDANLTMAREKSEAALAAYRSAGGKLDE